MRQTLTNTTNLEHIDYIWGLVTKKYAKLLYLLEDSEKTKLKKKIKFLICSELKFISRQQHRCSS